MTKAEKIEMYREKYPEYNVTDVQVVDKAPEGWAGSHTDLFEVYQKPSDAKVLAWRWILETYGDNIISVQGSSMHFSVHLKTREGVYMHITHANNRVLEVV